MGSSNSQGPKSETLKQGRLRIDLRPVSVRFDEVVQGETPVLDLLKLILELGDNGVRILALGSGFDQILDVIGDNHIAIGIQSDSVFALTQLHLVQRLETLSVDSLGDALDVGLVDDGKGAKHPIAAIADDSIALFDGLLAQIGIDGSDNITRKKGAKRQSAGKDAFFQIRGPVVGLLLSHGAKNSDSIFLFPKWGALLYGQILNTNGQIVKQVDRAT